MRRFIDETDQTPISKCFFRKIFKRPNAQVLVDLEERDVYLILNYKKGRQCFSIKQFIAQPAEPETRLPAWARQKCIALYFHYFSQKA